jgi:LAS superfamily LD-carboxypeptidase LdcB
VKYQTGLFNNGVKRRGSQAEAAKWVAPPGHSEHHTGWSLDLGEAGTPATDVDQTFEKTAAYLWLATHASEFSFENSFPKNNPQGVSYEPWHWRFVGSDAARKELRH